jgi:NAD(P) transhydrogenase subunit alpha
MSRRFVIPLSVALVVAAVLGIMAARDAYSGPPAGSGAAQVASNATSGDAEVVGQAEPGESAVAGEPANEPAQSSSEGWSTLYVFVLATFIGIGVIARVSRLLHTPLMSLTNAISAIAVVGSIIVTGSDYPRHIQIMGAVALFASMTNIVSGFLITDRMLKMFKTPREVKE